MRIHTQNYKVKIKEYGRQLDSKITFGETELGNEQLNAVTPVLQSSLLKSVMKELDIDSNVDIPVGTIINYKFGVMLNNGDYEYLDYGNYQVYSSEKQEDTNSYNIIAYDKMLNSMVEYTTLKDTTNSFPMTVRNYINAICKDINITFVNSNKTFANYDKIIQSDLYANLEYTYRDILDELAQVTASNIIINGNDELEIKYINNTDDTIDEEYLKDVNVAFGEKYGPINSIVLSRSAGADNVYLQDEQSIADNGLCELKISDNQIMNNNDRSDYLQAILQALNGLEYYINDFSSTGICYYEVADKYNVKIGENVYSCIMFNDEQQITQGLVETIHTDLPEQAETDYTKADKTDRRINQTYLIVNKQNQTIESVVSQVDGQNEKISQVTQTVDELNSKIQNIADITISDSTLNAKIELNGINESEPININIHPTGEDISYLYPHINLFPSDNLFMKTRTLMFHNKKTDEYFPYELPDDLLYYDANTYDEFVLDYDKQSCEVTKKVKYNSDGTKSPISAKTNSYDFPTIRLSDGDYEISLLGYSSAYLFVRLMASNIYTSQFATRVELKSAVTQTDSKIESEVSRVEKLLDTEVSNLSTKIAQTATSIDLTASDNETSAGITIRLRNENGSVLDEKQANITLSGLVAFENLKDPQSTTFINGANIITGTITANQVSSDIITTTNFSAQQINANNITTGTLSANMIKGGTINASEIYLNNVRLGTSSSVIGGWTVNSSSFSSGKTTLGANGRISFYPDVGGILVLNDGFRCKAPNGIAIYNDTPNFNPDNPNDNDIYKGIILLADQGNLTLAEKTVNYSVNIRSYCSSKTVSDAEGRCILLAAAHNIYMDTVDGSVWAHGNGLTNSRVRTDAGSSSSKNIKDNIIKFEDKDYQNALNLLDEMNLYSYDYKYNLYKNPHQYGFIIDELENFEESKKFFDFEEYNATAKGNEIDLSGTRIDGENLKVKTYNSDVLDKYLLTLCKALYNKIKVLEEKINVN